MGKLETLFRKLSIPMPRPKVCLADALLCPEITQNHAAALAEALGSLAGKGFSSPQKALAWAKKKKLLPKAPLQPQLMGYEAAFMAFCFVRAAGVCLALEGEQLILQQSEGALLPQWSLAAAQWSLSAQLLQSRELAQSMDTPGLRRLVQKLCKALELARQPLEKCYKLQLFGDSITDSSWGDCTTWVSFFPSRLGSGKAVTVNNAYGGGALSALPGKKNCVVRLLPKMLHPDADLVVVFASTNDFAANGPGIGLPGSRDKATLWGRCWRDFPGCGPYSPAFYRPHPPVQPGRSYPADGFFRGTDQYLRLDFGSGQSGSGRKRRALPPGLPGPIHPERFYQRATGIYHHRRPAPQRAWGYPAGLPHLPGGAAIS